MDVMMVNRDVARVLEGHLGIAGDTTCETSIDDVERHGTGASRTEPVADKHLQLVTCTPWNASRCCRRRGADDWHREESAARCEKSESES